MDRQTDRYTHKQIEIGWQEGWQIDKEKRIDNWQVDIGIDMGIDIDIDLDHDNNLDIDKTQRLIDRQIDIEIKIEVDRG